MSEEEKRNFALELRNGVGEKLAAHQRPTHPTTTGAAWAAPPTAGEAGPTTTTVPELSMPEAVDSYVRDAEDETASTPEVTSPEVTSAEGGATKTKERRKKKMRKRNKTTHGEELAKIIRV